MAVELIDITPDNLGEVYDLAVGPGQAAMALGIEECRRRGATELYTSWVVGDGGPEGFYLRLGFEPTGEWDDDEKVAKLSL